MREREKKKGKRKARKNTFTKIEIDMVVKAGSLLVYCHQRNVCISRKPSVVYNII
jgi:hypothetical protein